MSTAIVIISHGRTAEALLETVEMICGKQKNTAAVNFYMDMDNLILMENCKNKISFLDIEEGIIFFVDIFGGTPFNTAYILSKTYKNSYIISGVNIPMLIEAYEIRNDNIELEEKIYINKKISYRNNFRYY
ncbi:PTS sugar transporter subunit IIA [Brachyspira hampsonii]|uniref:PTS sugar transporter subunit IIA n=1 Tax=Brachyspira hampsonii TaxID=1287055 RepID=UPI0002AE3D5C|nr:PTS system mannose-specific transporter subunits IIAB [Brachyspira hampsonii]ELV05414.1 PTS system mannose-specific transporter subunits IIAB [Brachyspira hampsonii 30599]